MLTQEGSHGGRRSATAVFAVAMFAFLALFPSSASAAVSDNVSGWMWSGSVGWISMNCVDLSVCATSNYGVTIVDDPSVPGVADVSGYAWSENVGWVCFGETCSGTTPEGGAPYAQYRSADGPTVDEFHGWAQIISMGNDGWISLNCRNMDECAVSAYRTVLDPATGSFTKGGATDHWAWNGNDVGTGAGWIDVSLVSTSWVSARLGLLLRPQGIYEPDSVGLVGTHLTTATIGFMDFSAPINYQLRCDVKATDGSIRILTKTMLATVRNGTMALDYTFVGGDPVGGRPWIIEGCRIGTPVTAVACANDIPCGAQGYCDTTAGFCRTLAAVQQGAKPIFTHGNEWSGLDAAQDQYLALKCHAAFPGEYLNNAAQCDFAGDASFSLAMRRGIPLEGECGDGIDNDGNGQIDCADRYCKGISYLCQTLPRTLCQWGVANDGVNDCSQAGYETGDLCCNRQPVVQGGGMSQIVNGLECSAGDPKDGYFDCSCTGTPAFNVSGTDDCYAPGAQTGDLCCSAAGEVTSL
jgi:hypothetical protein